MAAGGWERLKGGGPFQRVFKEGRSTANGTIALLVLADPSGTGRRVAVAAGRRLGKAHERTRARRLLREAWRVGPPEVPEGTDVILLARPGILGMNAAEVRKALEDVMEKAGLDPGGTRRP